MTEKEAINLILNINNNDDESMSTLSIAIRGARELSDRDVETGVSTGRISSIDKYVVNNTYASNKFLSAISYLIIVDLIGSIFKKKGKRELIDNRFEQALTHFSSLEGKEKKVLKNLRNSLAHTFSLGNETEVFVLDYSTNSEVLIELAQKPYYISLRSEPKSEEHLTTVYHHNFCNLVEEIYTTLYLLNSCNDLEIVDEYKENNEIKSFHFRSIYLVK